MDRLKQTAKAFAERGITCRCFAEGREVLGHLLTAVGNSDRVAIGGSMTIQEMGIYESLVERGNEVLWHWKVAPAEMDRIRRDSLNADIYLTSSNAVIEDGRLLNIDGIGNRVAAMFFGPPRIIVIAGRNKLAADYTQALLRIRNVAAPQNARRLKRDTPCRFSGHCQDCRSPQRMCQLTVCIENRLEGRTLEVWLVDQDLGY